MQHFFSQQKETQRDVYWHHRPVRLSIDVSLVFSELVEENGFFRPTESMKHGYQQLLDVFDTVVDSTSALNDRYPSQKQMTVPTCLEVKLYGSLPIQELNVAEKVHGFFDSLATYAKQTKLTHKPANITFVNGITL